MLIKTKFLILVLLFTCFISAPLSLAQDNSPRFQTGSIIWSPSSRYLLVFQNGLWLYDTTRLLQPPVLIDTEGWMPVFSPDSHYIAYGYQTIKIAELPSGKRVSTLELSWLREEMAFSPNNQTIYTLSKDNILTFWHVTSGEKVAEHDIGNAVVAFNSDWSQLVTFRIVSQQTSNQEITLWRVSDETFALSRLQNFESGPINRLEFDTSDNEFYTISSGTIANISITDGSYQYTSTENSWQCYSSNQIQYLATQDKTLFASNCPYSDVLTLFNARDERYMRWKVRSESVFFDPAGNYLGYNAWRTTDQGAVLIDLETYAPVAQIPGRAITFSPDGSIFVTLRDDTSIWLWDMKTFQPLVVLPPPGLKFGF